MRLTPAEFFERSRIRVAEEKREWQRTAWLAACILSALSGKKIKPKRLLPWAFEEEKKEIWTKEKVNKELEELKQSVGIK